MAHSLAHFAISLPISSKRSMNHSNLPYPVSLTEGNRCRRIITKAMTGDLRENLDHLQRASSPMPRNQAQLPKKRIQQVTPIGLLDRFPTARTMHQMMDTMERMEDQLAYEGGWPSSQSRSFQGSGGFGRGRTPWEIKEGETDYKMRFDIPGMTKEDVKVWVEEKMLALKAEKLPKENEEWSAKSYGKYSCRIALPENVLFENINAEVKDGVLYITVPKPPTLSKIVEVNVK